MAGGRMCLYPTHMMDWRKNLLRAMSESGFDMKSLSVAAGLDPSIVSKLMKKPNPNPAIGTVSALAQALNMTVDQLLSGAEPLGHVTQQIPVIGEIAAGMWLEMDVWDEEKYESVPKMPSRYPGLPQQAWHVIGSSMDKAGILDGSFVVTVDYWAVRSMPTDGDIVVVEQSEANKVQRTCKEVRVFPGRYELRPHSTNPKFEPIVIPAGNRDQLEDVKVEIVGLVIWTGMPIGKM